jgi:hypothetical protein
MEADAFKLMCSKLRGKYKVCLALRYLTRGEGRLEVHGTNMIQCDPIRPAAAHDP